MYKVKYYNILNLYNKEVIYDLKRYALLRKTYNYNLKKRTRLSKKFKFIYKVEKLFGHLYINNWKKKIIKFNFLYNHNKLDINLYNIFFRKPSYLKYIYSKINRLHLYRQIYNLCYRLLLIYPYSIIIKPFVLIIKNYNVGKFFIIVEWNDKWSHLYFILKIIKKKKLKLNITKLIKNIFINKNKNIFNNVFLVMRNNKKIVNLFFKKKMLLLFWLKNNWFSRFRNNWKFIKFNIFVYTKRYRLLLLRMFNANVLEVNYFTNLVNSIFIERFIKKIILKNYNVWYKKRRFLKKKIIKISKISKGFNRRIFFKIKNLYLNKYMQNININLFFFRLYKLYFFWFLFFFYNIYIMLNKILFSIWLKFFNNIYLTVKEKKIQDYYYYFLKNNNNNKLYAYNFEFSLIKYFKYFYNTQYYYITSYYLLNLKSYYKSVLSKFIISQTFSYFFKFFKNMQTLNINNNINYYFKCGVFNYAHNNILFYLDFTDHSYIYIVNYKKYFSQLWKKYDFKLSKRLKKLIKFEDNNRYNFFKIHHGINIYDKTKLRYSNFELGLHKEKKLYFL